MTASTSILVFKINAKFIQFAILFSNIFEGLLLRLMFAYSFTHFEEKLMSNYKALIYQKFDSASD